jgi:Cu(I)/Ag(I) efflux system membrane fusion protein
MISPKGATSRNIQEKIRVCVFALMAMFALSCRQGHQDTDPNVFYTCSMDPQIMEKKMGRCPVCNMELTRIVLTGRENMDEVKLSDDQIRLGGLLGDTVTVRPIGDGRLFSGIIAVDEELRSVISAPVSGRIEKLFHNTEGAVVKEGDTLYALYSPEVNEAQKDLITFTGQGKEFPQAARMASVARNKLKLYGIGDRQISEIEEGRKMLSPIPFFSHTKGVVMRIMVQEGQEIMDGDVLFSVADLSRLNAEARVFGSDIYRIRKGDEVKVLIPDISFESTDAKITFVSPEPGASGKISTLRVAIPNKNELMMPGMEARILFESGKKNVLVAPVEALIREAGGTHVWVAGKQGSYMKRRVTTGMMGADYIEIKEGLKEGEFVVTKGSYLLNSEYLLRKANAPVKTQ